MVVQISLQVWRLCDSRRHLYQHARRLQVATTVMRVAELSDNAVSKALPQMKRGGDSGETTASGGNGDGVGIFASDSDMIHPQKNVHANT